MKFQIEPPKDSLKFQLQKAIAEAVNSVQGLSLRPEEVHLEHPENEEYGDYATNVAMQIFGKLKKNRTINNQQLTINNPSQLAEKIKETLEKQKLAPIDKISVVNNFINISIKSEWLINQAWKVLKKKDNFGKSQVLKDKKIMVEFAHPNTHKLFHIGHLRNISTGESIVRILEAVGCKVIRANYQGDVGLHIAKCLWGILQSQKSLRLRSGQAPVKSQKCKAEFKKLNEKIEFLGKCYVAGNKAYVSDERTKKEIIEINQKIYDRSDPEINKLWSETRSWSLKYFDRIYHRVYSHFDRFYFESEVFEKGREIVLEVLKKGVFVRSKGAIIFPGSKYGLHDRVFVNSEGNATYEGKDIGLAQLQFAEYQPDLVLHVVAPEQKGYFEVLFKALEQVFPQTKGKEYHLQYGWVRLKKGKMSSRIGKIVLGEWLLDEAKKRLLIIMKQAKKGKISKEREKDTNQVCERLAVGAVKYSFLKQGIDKDIAFDPEESISLEGNSGPYLQYTYARCRSVLEKAKGEDLRFKIEDLRLNNEELAVLRTLYKFPEVVWEAGEEFAPNLICSFLYDLAQKYNTFYNKHRILKLKAPVSTLEASQLPIRPSSARDASEGRQNSKLKTQNSKLTNFKSNFRLLLTAATAQVLKNGLNLLGIETPRKM